MKQSTSDLLTLAGTALFVGSVAALANHYEKKEKQREKRQCNIDISKLINTKAGSGYAKTVKPNQIDECMQDLQDFDAEFVKLVTEMGFVVTHIFSESSRSSNPFTFLGISSENMPNYLELAYEGDLDVCERYEDLLDTDMVKKAVDKILNGKDYDYNGLHYKDNPHKCLAKIYDDMIMYRDVYATNARYRQKSDVGCMGVEFDSENMMKWNRAVTNDTSSLTEFFWEFAISAHVYDRDLFKIVSVLLKMDAATMLEMNLDK